MSTLYSGSICLSELISKAKEGHSAFTKANNGKVYVNIKIWHNDQPDKYDNTHSIQLNSKEDKRTDEGNVYIGNAKPVKAKEPEAVKPEDVDDFLDLPWDKV